VTNRATRAALCNSRRLIGAVELDWRLEHLLFVAAELPIGTLAPPHARFVGRSRPWSNDAHLHLQPLRLGTNECAIVDPMANALDCHSSDHDAHSFAHNCGLHHADRCSKCWLATSITWSPEPRQAPAASAKCTLAMSLLKSFPRAFSETCSSIYPNSPRAMQLVPRPPTSPSAFLFFYPQPREGRSPRECHRPLGCSLNHRLSSVSLARTGTRNTR